MKMLIFLTAVFFSLHVQAQCFDEAASTNRAADKVAKANAKKSGLATRIAPITSAATLRQYNKMTAADSNPLQALSADARQRFVDSITFNEKGITGYRYVELESELTPTQISKILSLFGVQRNTSIFKKAPVKTVKDRLLISGAATPLSDCDDGDDSGDPGGGGDAGGGGVEGGGGGEGGADPAAPAPGPGAPQDYPGYFCSSPGTCKANRTYICLKSC